MATVACQYKTGKTLGSGTYAVVKEAVHIQSGKYYAVKVISKRLMRGREQMLKNEIAILKSVSHGHPHILTMHDYFETANNLYLVCTLCTGGELFDRLCAKGSYTEQDACGIVRSTLQGLEYLHSKGIVHRDLKPENLLFRSKDDDSDLLIADFGLSRLVDDSTFTLLKTVAGTPSYIAPEVFTQAGHGKPVDIWAIGVISYFLLCGYTPFDRDDQVAEIKAICAADYVFEPVQYWENISETARDFIKCCLTVSSVDRLTASQALAHPWLASLSFGAMATTTPIASAKDLLPSLQHHFNAKKTFKRAILAVRVANLMAQQGRNHSEREKEMLASLEEGKREAEEEKVERVLP